VKRFSVLRLGLCKTSELCFLFPRHFVQFFNLPTYRTHPSIPSNDSQHIFFITDASRQRNVLRWTPPNAAEIRYFSHLRGACCGQNRFPRCGMSHIGVYFITFAFLPAVLEQHVLQDYLKIRCKDILVNKGMLDHKWFVWGIFKS